MNTSTTTQTMIPSTFEKGFRVVRSEITTGLTFSNARGLANKN